jgi:uncharacterized membrane protein
MTVVSTFVGDDRASRWLVLVSLALNLFFIGAGGALLARHYLAPAASSPSIDRSVAGRIDRLAAQLPSADGEILRAEFRAHQPQIEAARNAYRQAQDEISRILRTEPFDADAMRRAMAQARAARQVFDQVLHEHLASAAARMSAEGRTRLADSRPRGPAEARR